MMNKLGRMENFTLRCNGGKNILWDLNAPGLHVLLNADKFMLFAGDAGRDALLYHSIRGDFFKKTYDILNRAGITQNYAPRVWSYLKELNKYADRRDDPETKANTNIQLFIFLQSFLEGTMHTLYLDNAGRVMKEDRDLFNKLMVTADSFIVKSKTGTRLAAGYPWFAEAWTRDTFISLPGLLLVTGRYEEAKEVFRFYAVHQREDGLLPGIVFPDGRKGYDSADSSLWFIEALNRYLLMARDEDRGSMIKELLPTVNRIIECYAKRFGEISLDADNLVVVPPQWTWMDACIKGRPVTPRNGKPVEIQALFYNALGIADRLNRIAGGRKSSERYGKLREEVADAINSRYFSDPRTYPRDVIDGDEQGAAMRPNAVFLISLSDGYDLLTPDKRETVIAGIERELLTPYGLRTLSPGDRNYAGRYDTFAPMEIKDRAYHQGTVWPFLMASYIRAKMIAARGKPSAELVAGLREKMRFLMEYVKERITLPEVFSGDEPYTPGGAVSQAWSVGALLEILDLLNEETEKDEQQKRK
jgi:glycogen debranching enzyme